MTNRKKICCIADAPGPAEMLAPVVPLLGKDCEVRVVAVGTAMSILEPFGAIACNDEAAARGVFEQLKPDLLVSAISSLAQGPYINNQFIEMAHENGIPIISLQDMWGNHRWPQNRNTMPYINAVCVMDEFAGSLWKDDGFKGEIFITGNPAFDRFASVDTRKERSRLRRELHLDEKDKVIVFAGQGTPHHLEEDKKTFSHVCEALRLLGERASIKLIARHHPRAAETAYYKEYSHGIATIDTPFYQFGDQVIPAADVVISMFSTLSLHACFLRIPAVSILLPEQGRRMLQEIGFDDFPPNVMEASAGVYDEDLLVLKETLEKIFTDGSFRDHMRAAQEKNFLLDGDAARRVTRAIKGFL